MNIGFNHDRWRHVREAYTAWWKGDLERPLVSITMPGPAPDRKKPDIPYRQFTAHYDAGIPAETIVDCWDYRLASQRYAGDGFPSIWPNFGPGVGAAFAGAELETDSNTVWFRPREERAIDELTFSFEADSPEFQRIAAIYRSAADRWQGAVQLSMTDLGGAVDLLSTFRPGENLLFDLYDNPDHVKRAVDELHAVWWDAFETFEDILQPVNPGYTAWTPIFSESRYYMLQCDFAYMIGPDMFDEFVKPELISSCRRLENAFYHLDGPGQLPHLDSLLAIPELKGIQWVPGAGERDVAHWPDIYRKIRDAGKLIQVFTGQFNGGLELADILTKQLGSLKGVCIIADVPELDTVTMDILRRYDVPLHM